MRTGAVVKISGSNDTFVVTRVEDEAVAYYYNIKEVRQYYVRPFDLESKTMVRGGRESKEKFDVLIVVSDEARDEATELEKSRKLNEVLFDMIFVSCFLLLFFVTRAFVFYCLF